MGRTLNDEAFTQRVLPRTKLNSEDSRETVYPEKLRHDDRLKNAPKIL